MLHLGLTLSALSPAPPALSSGVAQAHQLEATLGITVCSSVEGQSCIAAGPMFDALSEPAAASGVESTATPAVLPAPAAVLMQ